MCSTGQVAALGKGVTIDFISFRKPLIKWLAETGKDKRDFGRKREGVGEGGGLDQS